MKRKYEEVVWENLLKPKEVNVQAECAAQKNEQSAPKAQKHKIVKFQNNREQRKGITTF